MLVAQLLARLDRLAGTADQSREEHSRDALLRVLLSALSDPDLPLAVFGACADALRAVVSAQSDSGTRELSARARDLLRDATRKARSARHPAVREALAILLENPRWREEEDLAKELGVSRGHFAWLVHEEIGIDYRTLRRLVVMKAGVTEVLTTGEQVAQIAHGLGMLPGTFDEVFDETLGCCPRELRRLWSRLRH